MSLPSGEIVTILAALIAGGFVIWGEVIRRRTPSVEKEAEQEDQWRNELWEINRTLSADVAMIEKNLKETRKLQEQTEEQNELLRRQLTQIQQEKEAWTIEREEMRAQLKGLRQEVFDLTAEVNQMKRAQNGGK